MKSNKKPASRVFIFLCVIGLLALGVSVWWSKGLGAVDLSDTKPSTFIINKGDGVREITANLAEQQFIRDRIIFFLIVKFLGIERNIQAGDYQLSRSMDSIAIAQTITHGISDTQVLLTEGLRNEEYAEILSQRLPEFDSRQFLKDAILGYMFPATYDFPKDATSGAVIAKLHETFETKVTDQMRQDVVSTGLTFDEVIILASLVEKEGYSDADRPVIAGILYNRLAEGWPLQVDATLSFMLGNKENNWWKKDLTNDDKKIASTFNTYLNTGLPKSPIANPGLSAIKAAIYPKKTEYWFYLHDPQKQVHYAKTLEEHNQNIAQYLP